MSVYYCHLVVYGWKLPYDALSFEDYESYRYDDRDVGDAVVVADGMSGDYLFVGILQARSTPSHSGRAKFGTHEIPSPSRSQRADLDDVCSDIGFEPDTDPSQYVFTHFY